MAITKTDTKTAPKKAGGKKGPSVYNAFMKAEMPKVKAAHPTLSHKEAFKKVASNWQALKAKGSPKHSTSPKH